VTPTGHLTEPRAAQPAGTDGAPLSVRELLEQGAQALHAQEANASLAAAVLLAHTLQRPRSSLLAHPERLVGIETVAHFRGLIARRAAGEPLAYLTGEREFWSLPLQVTPDVLVPRPETELLVERALALLPARTAGAEAIRVVDLGTGSGAIVLALAAERPQWTLTATDRSLAALTVARANAQRLGLGGIEFRGGSWFEPLEGRRFEAIIANPPYIAADDAALAALRHEPAEALTPGPGGLEALRQLIAQAPAHLERGGWLLLEHGADQAAAVAAALVAAGYARVGCHRDLAGRDRVTEAQW
jgi:release factor glutamine methyltransferase